MSDERTAIHIAAWFTYLKDAGRMPVTVELRWRGEIVDSAELKEDSPYLECATDLIESAGAHALDEGKTCTYTVIAITQETSEQYECRTKIRKRVDKSAGDLIAVLTKQNAELHTLLQKERKQNNDFLLRLTERLDSSNKRLNEENDSHRAQKHEVFDRIENLRSKQLERDMLVEKTKADIETKERLVDAFVPLALAMANRFTKGALPGPDLQQVTLAETFKGLSSEQLEAVSNILGEYRQEFLSLLYATLEGQTTLPQFRAFVGHLPQEKVVGVLQILNMGQQAALSELLQGGSNGVSH